VCEKQLLHLIDKVHDVEVDEKAIGAYLPGIYKALEDLSKEEVIKRFTSLEFNRFLDYYRNAPDINVDASRGTSERGKMRTGNSDTMFINLGSADGFDPSKMLRYICETSDIKGNDIGRIDIKGVYSFIDIDRKFLPKVLTAFEGEVFRGRKVRVDMSQPGGGGGGSKSKGKSYSGSRSEGGDRKKRFDDGGSYEKKGRSSRDDKGSRKPKEKGKHRW